MNVHNWDVTDSDSDDCKLGAGLRCQLVPHLDTSLHTTVQACCNDNSQAQRGPSQLALLLLPAALRIPSLADTALVPFVGILLVIVHLCRLKDVWPIGNHSSLVEALLNAAQAEMVTNVCRDGPNTFAC